MKNLLKSVSLAILFLMAVGAKAQASPSNREGQIMMGSSTGFGLIGNNGFFVTDFAADYFFHPNISIGYEMLLGIGDSVAWGNQAVGKYTFDIHDNNLENFKPYLQTLMGFVVSDSDGATVGFLGGFGFGGNYFVDSHWGLGSNMIFEFSNDIAGRNFAWIWKVLEFKYLF